MIRKLVLAAAVVAIGVSVFGAVVHYTGPESNILIIASSFVPLLVLVGILGVIALVALRFWGAAVIGAALVVAAMATQAPLYFGTTDEPGGGTSVRVLQANIMKGEAGTENLVRTIRDRDIDIMTVEELTDDAVARLSEAGIDELLPEQFLVPKPDGGGGTGIYSRFPLNDREHLPRYAMANLSATVQLSDNEQLALFAVHPMAPYPMPSWKWADEMERLREAVHTRVKDDPDLPVLVSGDFNSTYSHTRYRTFLTDGFVDVAEKIGAGTTPTFPADSWLPAMIGIDRMIVRSMTVQEFEPVTLDESDHQGLFAALTTQVGGQ